MFGTLVLNEIKMICSVVRIKQVNFCCFLALEVPVLAGHINFVTKQRLNITQLSPGLFLFMTILAQMV